MSDNNRQDAVDMLVEEYLHFEKGNFILYYDSNSADIARAIRQAASSPEMVDGHFVGFNIDLWRAQYGGETHPSWQRGYDHLPRGHRRVLDNLLTEGSTVLYIMGHQGDEGGMRGELIDFIEERHKQDFGERTDTGYRIAGMPGCDWALIEEAFVGENITAFSRELEQLLSQTDKMYITTPAGTDLTISFDPQYEWINSNGIVPFGRYANPFPAEVYTYPASMQGNLVVDRGILGMDVDNIESRLQRTPLTLEIGHEGTLRESGFDFYGIQAVHCDDAEIKQAVVDKLKLDTYSNIMGELGMPAHLGLMQMLRESGSLPKNPSLKEKVLPHIAYGDPYGEHTGAPFRSKVHVDNLMGEATIIIERAGRTEALMENGEYVHPALQQYL